MKASKIRVVRTDPKTGEVLGERRVGRDHFKPKPLPRLPKVDERKVTVIERGGHVAGPTGRTVVYMIGIRERELAYWFAYGQRLTRDERSRLANGETSILRPIAPDWKRGDKLTIATDLTAEVTSKGWTHRGYRTAFKITDLRPFLLRQTPSANRPPAVDEHGDPLPPTAGEIYDARIDGAYTTSAAQAVPDAGAAMDDRLHRRLHAEASMANAMKQTKLSGMEKKLRLEERLAEARRKNWTGTVRYLERMQEHHKQRDEEREAA